MDLVGRFIAQESLKQIPPETTQQQRRNTEPEDSSSLAQRSSDIASCQDLSFTEPYYSSDTMNAAAAPSRFASITLEDCRDALKKFPNQQRLILQQNPKTGKISMVGGPSLLVSLSSQKESQENRTALQAVKNLIIECTQSYGRPSVNYHPLLLYRINEGAALDSETLRRILHASTGTIHGNAQGEDYEYQAALADPARNSTPDLPEGYVPLDETFTQVQSGLAKASAAVTKMSDKVSSLRFRSEDANARYKDYALHPNEGVSLLDSRTKEPTPGIK